MLQSDFYTHRDEIIKIIGIGGGGCNAVHYMQEQDIQGVQFFICNTDAQCLEQLNIPTKIHLGPELTQGLGAGSNPEIGRQATIESEEYIRSLLEQNTKMLFVTAGMGGGTGTGGAPIIAKIAKELSILTIGIVTTPFRFEGRKRNQQAEEGLEALKKHVDTLLIISNEKLKSIHRDLSMSNAFNKADDVLLNATKCVTDVINTPGKINVDFADVCTVMRNGGVAIFGNAEASGPERAKTAIQRAIQSPLLDANDIAGAQWVLLNISSPKEEHEITMDEIDIIQEILVHHCGQDSNIILGTSYNDTFENQIGITLIATAFSEEQSAEVKMNQTENSIAVDDEEKTKITVPTNVDTEEIPPIQEIQEAQKLAHQQTAIHFNEASNYVPLKSQEPAHTEKEKTVVLSQDFQEEILKTPNEPASMNNRFHIEKPEKIYEETIDATSKHEDKAEPIESENEETSQFTINEVDETVSQENSQEEDKPHQFLINEVPEIVPQNNNHETEKTLEDEKEGADQLNISEVDEVSPQSNHYNSEETVGSYFNNTQQPSSEERINPLSTYEQEKEVLAENMPSYQNNDESTASSPPKQEESITNTSNPTSWVHSQSQTVDNLKEAEDTLKQKETEMQRISIDPSKINHDVLNDQPSYLRNEAIKRFIEDNLQHNNHHQNSLSNYSVEKDEKSHSKINALNQFLWGAKPD